MAETTGIEWTDATFNPWRGCTKVSPGCAHCYAEAMSVRNPKVLGVWGDNGSRAIAAESYWQQPLKWNREAAAAGVRKRVFCASLADVFEDRPELDAPRQRLFDLILATQHLDWLLLTKRPKVMRDWLTGKDFFAHKNEHAWGAGWPNVWLGTSVEDQQRMKERGPVLLDIPAVVHFLSVEPMLGPVDASDYLHRYHGNQAKRWPCDGRIDWIICGGESGHHARPMQPEWVRDLRDQCHHAGAAFFFKQWGGTNKKAAGKELDGREWCDFPQVAA